MPFRFPNSRTVPLFHSHKAPSNPSTEQVKVIPREIKYFPPGHVAVLLDEMLTQRLQEKSGGILEPSSASCEKQQFLTCRHLCDSEKMIPAHLFHSVDEVTIYKCTSLGSIFRGLIHGNSDNESSHHRPAEPSSRSDSR